MIYTMQLTIVSCEYVNRNTSSTGCTLILSIVYPPNITPLLPGSVWRVNAAHGGGRVPVMTGTIHWPEENTWYHYDVLYNRNHLIPGDEDTHEVCLVCDASTWVVRISILNWERRMRGVT